MAEKKYLDTTGLTYLWGRIKGIIPTKTSDLVNDSNYINNLSDTPVNFTEATTRTNISRGETTSTLFGKIAKWFSDFKSVAFTGSYNDLTDKPTIPVVSQEYSATSTDAMSGIAVAAGIDEAVSKIVGVEFIVVTVLPETGELGKIYLLTNGGAEGNSYDEYIWLAQQSKWEKIGTTDIDLSDYQKASELIPITTGEIDIIVE